jgi:hypothetical protein
VTRDPFPGMRSGSLEPPAAVCEHVGHEWGSGSECERCGKPSAIPADAVVCRHGVPVHWQPPHDCEYSDRRDQLIPYAEAAADREVPPRKVGRPEDEERYSDDWSRAFHRHMAVLARGV